MPIERLQEKIKIRFLYFADCPSHEDALARLKKVLEEESVSAEIEIIEVVSDEQATELEFMGSPSILVGGRDIDPEALEGQAPGLACRVYRHPDGRFSPLPSESMIREALRRP